MKVWIRQVMAYRHPAHSPMPFPVPGWMWDRSVAIAQYDQRLAYIRRLEALGFDGAIFTEHHYGTIGGLTPSPNIMLAAATQLTERIALVTMGNILALHAHPVRLAEELAMLDNLSHGRLVAGFVSGNEEAHYAYSIRPQEARGRQQEAYALIHRAWTDANPFEWRGEYFQYNCVSILPRPFQTPHPPVWTSGLSAETLEWAARNRIGLVASGTVEQAGKALDYYRQYAAAHCDWRPDAISLGLSRELMVLPTMAQAREFAERLYSRDRQDHRGQSFTVPHLDDLTRQRYTPRSYEYLGGDPGDFASRAGTSFEEMQANGTYVVGDPDSVAEQLVRQQQTLGAGVLIVRPELTGMPLDQVVAGLELFAREVLPTLQAL